MEIAEKKEQELSEYIRATHGKLRNEYRKCKDPDAVWSVHIENKEELQHYAAAMHKLAEFWEAKDEGKNYVSRINWCYQALQTYFRKGELEKTRDKELRTVFFHLPHLLGPPNGASNETVSEQTGVDSTVTVASKVSEIQGSKASGDTNSVSDTADSAELHFKPAAAESIANEGTEANSRTMAANSTNCDVGGDHVESQSIDCAAKAETMPSKDCGTVCYSSSGREHIVYGDRLKVLDVGSCYNPFSRHPDLDVIALDLQPATEDVYHCDFLKLNISDSKSSFFGVSHMGPGEERNEIGSADRDISATTPKVITSLPANSFDAVVFSFLLSYIPSPELRLRCCKNAYSLLKPEGALVIAAADSRDPVGNGYVYKCWQITLASLGFVRVNYKKFKDFHGMVFRKGMFPEVWQIVANRKLEEMKAKKSVMETDLVTLRESGMSYSKRRIRQVESFDLDTAFIGLWLPHDFNESNEEEYIVKATKEGSVKRAREVSADFSEQENDAVEPASKTSKGVCLAGELVNT